MLPAATDFAAARLDAACTAPSGAAVRTARSRAAAILKTSAIACFCVLVSGQLLLAIYVVGFYGRAALQGRLDDWNKALPNGYVAGDLLANLMLSLHLAFAVVVIVGGALQLLAPLRNRWPRFHRWNGRVYLLAAIVIAVGGSVLLWTRDTPGDRAQHVAITINAVLILVCAAQALRHAVARALDRHRRWALRLYLAVAGAWFFRVGLMFWLLVNRGPVGFDPATFRGPTLVVLAFAQYLLPLALLELYFRAKASRSGAVQLGMATVLAALTLAVTVGIVGASLTLWLPRL